jgi:hypothetical protein
MIHIPPLPEYVPKEDISEMATSIASDILAIVLIMKRRGLVSDIEYVKTKKEANKMIRDAITEASENYPPYMSGDK